LDIEATGFSSFPGSSIDHRPGRRAIAIDSIGPGAERADVFAGDFLGTIEREVLIAAAHPTMFDVNRYFAAREQADALLLLP